MDNYETFTRTTNRLCAQAFDGTADADQHNNRLHQLYNKIKKSRLTVYQKDRLLQLLDDTLEATERHTNDLMAA